MNKQTAYRIAITGASGFIGKALIADLSKNNYSHLRLITRSAAKIPTAKSETGIEWVIADLTNKDSLIQAFKQIDLVLNLAAEVRNEGALEATNINGTINLIEAIEHNDVRHLIHLSSVGVIGAAYSIDPIVLNETASCTPGNAYERTKYQSEQLLLNQVWSKPFTLTILRPTNVYGPNHPFNALLHFMQHIKTKKPLIGTSTAQVNYVFVLDLTAAICHFIAQPKSGIFQVGSNLNLHEFTKLIAKQFSTKPLWISIPKLLPRVLTTMGFHQLAKTSNEVVYDDQLLLKEFTYPYNYEKGIASTILHYHQIGLLQ